MRAGAGRRREGAHLEGLGVPVLDLVDGRHVAEVVGELVELLDSVLETFDVVDERLEMLLSASLLGGLPSPGTLMEKTQ